MMSLIPWWRHWFWRLKASPILVLCFWYIKTNFWGSKSKNFQRMYFWQMFYRLSTIQRSLNGLVFVWPLSVTFACDHVKQYIITHDKLERQYNATVQQLVNVSITTVFSTFYICCCRIHKREHNTGCLLNKSVPICAVHRLVTSWGAKRCFPMTGRGTAPFGSLAGSGRQAGRQVAPRPLISWKS